MRESALTNAKNKIKIYYRNQNKTTTFVAILVCLFIAILLSVFVHPIIGIPAGIGGYIAFEFIRLLFYQPSEIDEERRYERSTEGDFGTAQPMSDEEKERTFIEGHIKDMKANIVGAEPRDEDILYSIKKRHGINNNWILFGAPSSGKTRCIAIPMIMQTIRRSESLIVTDPKGELYRKTSAMARANGYVVKVINFNSQTMLHSDSCNYLSVVGTNDLRASAFARTVIENTQNGEKMDFWAKMELGLLTAEILKVMNGDEFPEKSISAVYQDIVSNKPVDLASYFETITWDNPAKGFGMNFNTGDQTVQGNTKGGLASRLDTLNNPVIQKVTSVDDIDLTLPGKKKCIYYVASSDQDNSMQFYMALFFTLLYQELVNYADSQPSGELPVRVTMLLDEFRNIGIIPGFPQKLATVRGRAIDTVIILQDLGQLQVMYPENEWESIINCCSLLLCLRTNSMLTADYISKRSGIETIVSVGKTYKGSKLDPANAHMEFNMREQKNKRNSMNPDEVCRLESDEILAIPTGCNAVVLKKMDYERHPMCKELRDALINWHLPKWVAEIMKTRDEYLMQKYHIKKSDFKSDKKLVESIDLCTAEDFEEYWSPEKTKRLKRDIAEGVRRENFDAALAEDILSSLIDNDEENNDEE